MQTNGTIQVNDTLAVFVEDAHLAIGRDDGGLVTIDLPEVRHLVDTLVTLAAEQATGQELAGLGQAAVAGWCADALMDNGARLDEVQAENLRLRGELAQVRALLAEVGLRAGDDLSRTLASLLRWYRRTQAANTVWFERACGDRKRWRQARRMAGLWKQAAKGWRRAALEYLEAFEPPQRVLVVGELSGKTTPADFAQFRKAANGAHAK